MTAATALSVKNLHKSFGNVEVLKIIDAAGHRDAGVCRKAEA